MTSAGPQAPDAGPETAQAAADGPTAPPSPPPPASPPPPPSPPSPTPPPPSGPHASEGEILQLGTGLIILGLLLGFLLVDLWPRAAVLADKADKVWHVCLISGGLCLWTTADQQVLLLVMIAGALGSFIHAATSFGDFVGNQRFSRSWTWWYLLRPFVGMALAAVFYLVMRGGLLSGQASSANLNLYGVTAVAALVGMFSKKATDKLSEVFETLFRTAEGRSDDSRQDKLGGAGSGQAPAPAAGAATAPAAGSGADSGGDAGPAAAAASTAGQVDQNAPDGCAVEKTPVTDDASLPPAEGGVAKPAGGA